MPRAHVRPNTVSGSYALKKHKIGEILQKSAKNGPFSPVFSTFWHQKFTRGYQFLHPVFDPISAHSRVGEKPSVFYSLRERNEKIYFFHFYKKKIFFFLQHILKCAYNAIEFMSFALRRRREHHEGLSLKIKSTLVIYN